MSPEMLAAPEAVRFPPLALTELAQPLPLDPLFAHGQAAPVPSPKQNAKFVAPPGTSTLAVTEPGAPARHSPSVAVPATGATFASKRKL